MGALCVEILDEQHAICLVVNLPQPLRISTVRFWTSNGNL